MNLINEQLVHHTFGLGQIVSLKNQVVTIKFDAEMQEKVFQYPGAFEKHLKMCNPLAQNFVLGELKKFMGELAAGRELNEQQRIEATNRIAAEKVALRKSAVKKTKRIATTKKDI